MNKKADRWFGCNSLRVGGWVGGSNQIRCLVKFRVSRKRKQKLSSPSIDIREINT